MNQMNNNRRQLTPAQRATKIECDRRRRRERKTEFERLQKSEADLQAILVTQKNENTSLREDNERLKDMVSRLPNTKHQVHEQNRELREKNRELNDMISNLGNIIHQLHEQNREGRETNLKQNDLISKLQNTIHQLREQNRELLKKNLELEETMKLADSLFDFDKIPSPNEEATNNEPITEGQRSYQSCILYAESISELVIEQNTESMLKK